MPSGADGAPVSQPPHASVAHSATPVAHRRRVRRSVPRAIHSTLLIHKRHRRHILAGGKTAHVRSQRADVSGRNPWSPAGHTLRSTFCDRAVYRVFRSSEAPAPVLKTRSHGADAAEAVTVRAIVADEQSLAFTCRRCCCCRCAGRLLRRRRTLSARRAHAIRGAERHDGRRGNSSAVAQRNHA